MADIHPRPIPGRWTEGWVLDLHTESSVPIGAAHSGLTEFDTKRTEIGELVFRLKNRNDHTGAPVLAALAAVFIRKKGWHLDGIVPVPPSKTRPLQPVLEIAEEIGNLLDVPVLAEAVIKIKATQQMKDIPYRQRSKELADAYSIDAAGLNGRAVLLFDDLFETGSSMKVVADKLLDEARVGKLFALALTITRSGARL